MNETEELIALQDKLLDIGFRVYTTGTTNIDAGHLFMTYEYEDKSAIDISIYRFGRFGIELRLYEYKGVGKGHIGKDKEYDTNSSKEFDSYDELLEYLEV